MIAGSCHCGAVRIEVETAPDEVTDCNCTLCRRTGARWAYYHPRQVRVEAAPGATVGYVQGDRTLATHHCRTCGCITHWTATDPALERMAINVCMFEPELLARARVRRFDGYDTWETIEIIEPSP
jgi:hypothetical protein